MPVPACVLLHSGLLNQTSTTLNRISPTNKRAQESKRASAAPRREGAAAAQSNKQWRLATQQMAHRNTNAPGGGHDDGDEEEEPPVFPLQVGMVPLPIPARHCRAFRTGTCTREGCRQLHLTCPDGRTCMNACVSSIVLCLCLFCVRVVGVGCATERWRALWRMHPPPHCLFPPHVHPSIQATAAMPSASWAIRATTHGASSPSLTR